ncbi:hypothetical protein H4R33_001393 [Dimargaris cristalligena]|nr:hypothetical protein H4R33_001393 [Dimargaris cristalligena]
MSLWSIVSATFTAASPMRRWLVLGLAGALVLPNPLAAARSLPQQLVRRHGADEIEMGDSDDAEALAACFATDDHHDYNVGLHVAALFVIFFFSSLGALTPILASRYPRLSIPPVLLECGKFFGAGVILATSLIHMLPGAVSNFSSPCAPAVFSEYSAFPGLFTMLAIFLFHLMEHLLTGHFISEKNAPRSHHDHSHHPQAHDHSDGTVAYQPTEANLPGAAPAYYRTAAADSDTTPSDSDIVGESPKLTREDTNGHQVLELHSQHTHVHGGAFFSGAENETRRSSTYILEVGIAMHSVLIGLALGTASGTEFTSLFIALVIHQFFEGFALGSRLAELVFKRSAVPVASALIFAITTPIGVAIGMGVHSSYQANSPANLVTQGVLDSIAAGILLYSALVNLIAQEFSQASFYRQSKVRRALFFISMYTGAAVMAIIGIWA